MSKRNVSTLLALAVLLAFGSWVRIDTALSLPEFDAERAEGMLRSDPGLLYYMTQRVVDSGGGLPEDFRSDLRIEFPLESDLPAMFTVGQEFLVAWLYLLFGGDLPLHTFALIVMAIIASTVVLGVFGLATELSGSRRWGAFAAALCVLLPGNYRSLSFIFLREDLSLPFYALHLWLLARAVRLRTPSAFFLAGLSLVLSLATWHAMGMVVLVEAACFLAWFIRTGKSPLAVPGAWLFVAVLAVGACAVPVLWAKLYVLSPAMQIASALGVAAVFERRFQTGQGARVAVALGALLVFAIFFGLAAQWITPGIGDYSHVYELMAGKLRFLGERPDDPALLSFGARIMWQGPFASGSFRDLLDKIAVPLLMLPLALPGLIRTLRSGRGDVRGAGLAAFTIFFVFASMAVLRMRVVLGLVVPVVAAVQLARLRPRLAVPLAVAALALQALSLHFYIRDFTTTWYNPPAQAALVETVDWIRENLPGEGAFVSDVLNATAILAHTRHPVVLQPKYETARSRQRLEAFIVGLYESRPKEFSVILAEELGATYLLVDVPRLRQARYLAGVSPSIQGEPRRSAAHALLHPRRRVYAQVPGFTLLYETSPKKLRIYRID